MKARHEFSSDEEYQKYLRTYFAAMAMQGLLASDNQFDDADDTAKSAVNFVDALLSKLNE